MTVVLKIGQQHIIDCYKKNSNSLCNSNKALSPKEELDHDGHYIHFCGYASECRRLRRKILNARK